MFSIRTTYKTLTHSCAARVNGSRLPSVMRTHHSRTLTINGISMRSAPCTVTAAPLLWTRRTARPVRVRRVSRVTVSVAWTRKKRASADRRLSAIGLDELFREQNVFGSDDDRGFHPNSYW